MLGPATLRANSVRFIGATASAVGIQAPTAGVTFLPAIMAGIVGEAGPLAFLLALIAMLLVSYAFIVFAADFASAGSVFAFNGRALGSEYGFISAWLVLGVYIAYSASIYASNANFLEALVGTHATIAWPVFAFVFWVLALVLAYRRISVSTLLIFALEGAAIVLVAVVAVAVLAKGGYGGHGHIREAVHARERPAGDHRARRYLRVHRVLRLRGGCHARRGDAATRAASSRHRCSRHCSSPAASTWCCRGSRRSRTRA